ncbi:MAG: ABC transporter substrate-binding protein [Anaerocolumna aminovalerica]|jgi:branched-chain amino acid transport system substrate-binding protein|uniref:ABC transporter substrate-binding protein n=1 Tax=Anaerocolumna aminovalerica TaxID=1527 RepID=UPI00290B12B4|nr:ABC transporter substrate-binding protein [Anaerocolumna aminovalerica]MDU6266010.1 ABC transporter substrate-binding protein [Anaerocolumna aminovalerica]
MKKSLKKVLSLGLVSVMTASLFAGCGKKDSGSDAFIIGGLGPLSGKAASYGVSVKQGANIAVEKINAEGGVKVGDKTIQLKLNFVDDEASPDVAVSAYNTVMDNGAQAILGAVTSDAHMAITDLTNYDGILTITPSASIAGATAYPNIFRLCFTDPVQGITMAKYAIETLGHKKIAVIYNNSDPYSTGVKDAFNAEVAKLGGEIVASEAFEKDAVDFSTQLTKIKGSGAEIIFVPTYYTEASYIATQAAELSVGLPFIGSDGWDGILAQVVDAKVLEGSVFLSPFVATDENPDVQSFVEAYQKEYKAVPDQFAADGYDVVYLIKAALEKAGTTDSKDLVAAMTQIKVDGLTGSVSFDEDGEPNKGAKFVKIENGKYVAITVE